MSNAALLETPLASQTRDVKLLGIGLAAPPGADQMRALEFALETLHPAAISAAWLKRVFRNSGIRRRSSVLNDEAGSMIDVRAFYPPAVDANDLGPTTAQRMKRYALEAPPLAVRASRAALDQSHVKPADISHVVTASCTGFFAPGLDSALIEHLNLPRDIGRTHIGFQGCHAAVNALAVAAAIARANASARVLVCCVELCSLHFHYGADPDKMVSNALFADGAAAVVVGRAGSSHAAAIDLPVAGDIPVAPEVSPDVNAWTLRDFASMILPDSRDAMGWTIGDHGFEMTLSPGVPLAIESHLGSWISRWLATHGLKISDIAGWAVHPGGPKILDAVAAALKLPPDQLVPSRSVLSDFGNMSSPTILFVLQRLAALDITGPCVALGLGPGLAGEAMLLYR